MPSWRCSQKARWVMKLSLLRIYPTPIYPSVFNIYKGISNASCLNEEPKRPRWKKTPQKTVQAPLPTVHGCMCSLPIINFFFRSAPPQKLLSPQCMAACVLASFLALRKAFFERRMSVRVWLREPRLAPRPADVASNFRLFGVRLNATSSHCKRPYYLHSKI